MSNVTIARNVFLQSSYYDKITLSIIQDRGINEVIYTENKEWIVILTNGTKFSLPLYYKFHMKNIFKDLVDCDFGIPDIRKPIYEWTITW